MADYYLGKRLKSGRGFDYIPNTVSDVVVGYYNENLDQACFLANWEIGVPRDISGKVCAKMKIQDKDVQIYDLISQEGSHLQFGSFPNSGGSLIETKRPEVPVRSVSHKKRIHLAIFEQRLCTS